LRGPKRFLGLCQLRVAADDECVCHRHAPYRAGPIDCGLSAS
jgi:hypothetical protein